ncbi:hypothetical protein [Vibrio phage LP.1]|nr:hypothetical protein [Vibrio phage LP.1]
MKIYTVAINIVLSGRKVISHGYVTADSLGAARIAAKQRYDEVLNVFG